MPFLGWKAHDSFVQTNWIKAEVTFGAPKLGCKGVGICKILMSSTVSKGNGLCDCPQVSTKITLDSDLRYLFVMEKQKLNPSTIGLHFRDQQFIVTETFSCPRFMTHAFPDAPTKINPGIYPVLDDGQYITIKF